MTFALGFICGLVVGSWLSYLALDWLSYDKGDDYDQQTPFWRPECPPCTGDCQQGRSCPKAQEKKDE